MIRHRGGRDDRGRCRTGGRRGGILRLLTPLWALALLCAGAPVRAQEQPRAEVGVEQLTAYARAFVAIAAARDEAQAQLADARNKTAEAQQAIREALKQNVARIIESHGLVEEAYARITYVISVDAAQRDAFEKILAELQKPKGSRNRI